MPVQLCDDYTVQTMRILAWIITSSLYLAVSLKWNAQQGFVIDTEIQQYSDMMPLSLSLVKILILQNHIHPTGVLWFSKKDDHPKKFNSATEE